MFYRLESLLKSLFDDLFLAIPAAVITAVVYWVIRRALHKKRFGADFKEVRRKALLNEIIRLLLVLWLVLVFGGTLLPSKLEMEWHYMNNLWHFTDFFNAPHWDLVPGMIRHHDIRSYLSHFALNAAMFMPIGLALPFVLKRGGFGKVVLIGFCMTFTIEFLQGFIDRDPGLDDVFFNTLGTVLGCLLYLLMKLLLPRFTEKCNVRAKK